MTKDLLHDLASYKSFKDKGVMMAARSLIQLFRNVRPEFLQKKDRVGEKYVYVRQEENERKRNITIKNRDTILCRVRYV